MNENVLVADARAKIEAPAICLLVVATLGILLALFNGATTLVQLLAGAEISRMDPAQYPEEARELVEQFQQFEELLGSPLALAGWLLSSMFHVLYCSFLVVAAVQMLRLRSYVLCKVGSVLAIIPCLGPPCCCCAFFPLGIWALVVLGRPEVQQAFLGQGLATGPVPSPLQGPYGPQGTA